MSEKPNNNPGLIDKLNPLKWGPALSKAFKEAFKSKDKRVSVFFSTFFAEMGKVDEEKGKVTKETKEGTGKVVDKTLEGTRKAAGLKEGAEEADKEFYDEVLAMAHTSYRGLEDGHKSDFDTAFAQLDKAMKGESTETLTIDQSAALGAVGLGLILKLKEKYPEEEKFKEALAKLEKISENSSYPLKKLLSRSVLAVFKVDIDLWGEGLSKVGSWLGGEKSPLMKFLDKFGMDEDEAKLLAKLKTSPIEDEEEVVEVMKKRIFPNTDKEKVLVVAKKISQIIKEKPASFPLEALAELAFNIDNTDLKRLFVILGGKEIKSV